MAVHAGIRAPRVTIAGSYALRSGFAGIAVGSVGSKLLRNVARRTGMRASASLPPCP
jgi:hypothetical protein